MRGINVVFVTGNVGDVYKNESDKDVNYAFWLAIQNKDGFLVWVMVKAFGGLVTVCENRLKKGVYVVVNGELTTSIKDGIKQLEIKAKELIFPNLSKIEVEE